MTELHLVPKPPPYDHEADEPMFPCGTCGAPAGRPCNPIPHEGLRPAGGVLLGVILGVLIGTTFVLLWVFVGIP